MNYRSLILISIGALALQGCGTTTYEKNKIIPQSEYTMKEVYDNRGAVTKEALEEKKETQQEVIQLQMRPMAGNQDMSVYELNNVQSKSDVKKLPNPTLYLYFPAKISKVDGLPIPAWMSEFKMYDKDEYALPGEQLLGVRK